MSNPSDEKPLLRIEIAATDEEMCQDTRHAYICTRVKGHAGDHVAHGGDGDICDQWPQNSKQSDAPDIQKIIGICLDNREKPESREQELEQALTELRDAVSDFGGHGMPGFRDRADAIVALAGADRALRRTK